MDPTYQQAMIQSLMSNQFMAPGTNGQNASTPYGASFMTGNQSMDPGLAGQQVPGTQSFNPQSMQQPYAAYPAFNGA